MQLNGYVNTKKTTKVHHERTEKKQCLLSSSCLNFFSQKLYTERHKHKTLILQFTGIHILVFAILNSVYQIYTYLISLLIYIIYIQTCLQRELQNFLKKKNFKQKQIYSFYDNESALIILPEPLLIYVKHFCFSDK